MTKLAEGVNNDVCVNDLEPPAFEALPRLNQLKKVFLFLDLLQLHSVLNVMFY